MKLFEQKQVVLVTGAGQGNGRALAVGLAKAGASVAICDLNEETLQQTRAEIEAVGGSARLYKLDVTDAQKCKEIAGTVEQEMGPVSVLVNNAGVLVREGMSGEHVESTVRKVMEVNFHGTHNMIVAFLPQLKETRGNIINIASIGAFIGWQGTVGYSPSKGAVKMLTQSLAGELSSFGIRVNAIAPGVMETPMTTTTRSDAAKLDKLMQRVPMGRIGKPEELVGPALFLATSMSSYVTGITLPVDGGYLAV